MHCSVSSGTGQRRGKEFACIHGPTWLLRASSTYEPVYKIPYNHLMIRFILEDYRKAMLRNSYDNCHMNHTISQVENLWQTCDHSYDNHWTNLNTFCKSCTRCVYKINWLHCYVEQVIDNWLIRYDKCSVLINPGNTGRLLTSWHWSEQCSSVDRLDCGDCKSSSCDISSWRHLAASRMLDCKYIHIHLICHEFQQVFSQSIDHLFVSGKNP